MSSPEPAAQPGRTLAAAAIATTAIVTAAGGAGGAPAAHHLGGETFRVAITAPAPVGDDDAATWGGRYDRTAHVHSITLDGREFLVGLGLVDEFGMLGTGVLGYDTAAVGEPFLKIGVGVLERTVPHAYQNTAPYPLVRTFPVDVIADARELRITQQSDEIRGYAYRLEKTYRVDATTKTLTITWSLTNTGRESFSFEHYNHHFLGFDGASLGEAVRITLGYRVPSLPHAWLRQDGHTLRITGTPGVIGFMQVNQPLTPAEAAVALEHAELGMRVRIEGDFPVFRAAYYFAPSSFSSEHFFRAAVAPGESARWSSRYTFEAAPRAGAPPQEQP